MEVLLKKSTEISTSRKTLNVSNEIESKPVLLTEVEKITKVAVIVKVLAKRTPIQPDGGKTKQVVIVADSTGVMHVTLWEERVDALEPQKSYKLASVGELECEPTVGPVVFSLSRPT